MPRCLAPNILDTTPLVRGTVASHKNPRTAETTYIDQGEAGNNSIAIIKIPRPKYIRLNICFCLNFLLVSPAKYVPITLAKPIIVKATAPASYDSPSEVMYHGKCVVINVTWKPQTKKPQSNKMYPEF